ncbi:class I SAM-dependent methyltransferase [Candidatus Woesearchaeota archaeon]|nr:class I SAM-dependent methyltransferase [Candidatus Woesearchaeota archaeon]
MKLPQDSLRQKKHFSDKKYVDQYIGSRTQVQFTKTYLMLRYRDFRKKVLTEINRPQEKMGLDLMCGHGALTELFSQKTRKMYGVDISSQMLDHFPKKHWTPKQGDAYAIPFSKETFDFVVIYGSLHHCKDIVNVFFEVNRVLKPKGLFIFDEPCDDFFIIRFMRTFIYTVSSKFDEKTERGFQTKELIQALKKTGFSIKSIEKDAFYSQLFHSDVIPCIKHADKIPGINTVVHAMYRFEKILGKVPLMSYFSSNIRIIAKSKKTTKPF